MRVRIEFCTEWNYGPRAAGLAAEIKKELGVESEMKPSHGGVFEVTADGRLVFSKKATGRFPEAGEVLALLRSPKGP